jgi:hypothetical protein
MHYMIEQVTAETKPQKHSDCIMQINMQLHEPVTPQCCRAQNGMLAELATSTTCKLEYLSSY